jgi:hypothetical protein
MSTSWNTLHIFGFGTNQAIGDNYNTQKPAVDCPETETVADGVYALKPSGSTASSDYHAINCFHNMFIDFQPSTGEGFRVQWEDVSTELVDEIQTLVEEVVAE